MSLQELFEKSYYYIRRRNVELRLDLTNEQVEQLSWDYDNEICLSNKHKGKFTEDDKMLIRLIRNSYSDSYFIDLEEEAQSSLVARTKREKYLNKNGGYIVNESYDDYGLDEKDSDGYGFRR